MQLIHPKLTIRQQKAPPTTSHARSPPSGKEEGSNPGGPLGGTLCSSTVFPSVVTTGAAGPVSTKGSAVFSTSFSVYWLRLFVEEVCLDLSDRSFA